MSSTVFADYANNKISSLVQGQSPEFVRENYQTYLAFIEAYYEWMEMNGNVLNLAKNIPNYLNPDFLIQNSILQFTEYFRNQFMKIIPSNVLANKALLQKHIKEFYSVRGTNKSYKFLFRILWNEDVDIINTGNKVLIASGGQWYQPTLLRIQTSNNVEDFVNTEIKGLLSYTTAVVDKVNINYQDNLQYYELDLNNIQGVFNPNEVIIANTASGNTLYANITGIVSGVKIVNPGNLYNVGDPVIINGSGIGANAYVSAVSPGTLQSIVVRKGGSGYQIDPNYKLIISANTIGDPILASIASVDTSDTIEPNSYTIGNTQINTSSVVGPSNPSYNSSIWGTTTQYTYDQCGPISLVIVSDPGGRLVNTPNIEIVATSFLPGTNTYISDYGIIGTFDIINGGLNYAVGDDIKVVNITSRGVGAGARVNSVNANGSILQVIADWPSITGTVSTVNGSNAVFGTNTIFTGELTGNNDINFPGGGSIISINNTSYLVTSITNNKFLTVNTAFSTSYSNNVARMVATTYQGGFGYLTSDFPSGVVCNVISQNGTGAIIQPDSILGKGAVLEPVGSLYGLIQTVTITNFGFNYTSIPTIDMTGYGDGTAILEPNFLSGIFHYPGYYLNEDGFLSAKRYLQDPKIYNSYSFILRSKITFNIYRNFIEQILNPAGSNMNCVTEVQNDIINNVVLTSDRNIEIKSPQGQNLDSFILDYSRML